MLRECLASVDEHFWFKYEDEKTVIQYFIVPNRSSLWQKKKIWITSSIRNTFQLFDWLQFRYYSIVRALTKKLKILKSCNFFQFFLWLLFKYKIQYFRPTWLKTLLVKTYSFLRLYLWKLSKTDPVVLKGAILGRFHGVETNFLELVVDEIVGLQCWYTSCTSGLPRHAREGHSLRRWHKLWSTSRCLSDSP